MSKISLAPPRNPHSQSARDRRWTVIMVVGYNARYIELYGTSATNPEGAQLEANRILKYNYTWVPKGHGFRADLDKESND